MGSTPLGGCRGYFLNFLFLDFRPHIKDSKWGKKYIFINCTSYNGSPKQIPFQFAMGNCPITVAFWALSYTKYSLQRVRYRGCISFLEI